MQSIVLFRYQPEKFRLIALKQKGRLNFERNFYSFGLFSGYLSDRWCCCK